MLSNFEYANPNINNKKAAMINMNPKKACIPEPTKKGKITNTPISISPLITPRLIKNIASNKQIKENQYILHVKDQNNKQIPRK